MNIVLASTSPYRQELLARLGIPFMCIAPEVDETLITGESPQDRARRLAISKALAIPADTALIIGATKSLALMTASSENPEHGPRQSSNC